VGLLAARQIPDPLAAENRESRNRGVWCVRVCVLDPFAVAGPGLGNEKAVREPARHLDPMLSALARDSFTMVDKG